MSARKLLALLVVVMLGLLLICPTALARPEMPLRDVSGSSFTTNPDEDDEDPDDPNGSKDGDDDNWDKSTIKGHTVAESYGGRSGVGMGVDSSSSEDVLSRMEAALKLDDLAGALQEAEALPESAAVEMEGWLAQVRERAGALQAFKNWRGALEVSEE